RHSDAHWESLPHVLQHAVAHGPVHVQPGIDTGMGRRKHVWLALDTESDMADQSLVEYRENRIRVVPAAFAIAAHGGSRGLSHSVQGGLRLTSSRECTGPLQPG